MQDAGNMVFYQRWLIKNVNYKTEERRVRELKFRAWSPTEKAFVGNGDSMDLYYSAKVGAFMFDNDNLEFPEDVIWLQFTGLKDKNGKDIFAEGNASLDRIDSNKDYTIDNIQWIDKDLQRLKNNLSEQRFIELCRRVINYADNKL